MEKPGRNDPCWCGSGKKYKKCHIDFDEKIEEFEGAGHIVPSHEILKNAEQIEKIKESAKINIAVLDYVAEHIKAGISTAEIDKWVYDITTKMGGVPSEDVIIKDGDIINVDVSTNLNGYFSDSSRMFCIGNVSEENRKLVEETKNAVYEGLKQVKPWGFLGDMGQAVNDYVKSKGYSVVREVGGHGIGLEFHEDPWVSYISKKGTEMLMVPGMIFTIEPMVNAGKPDIFVDEDNGWTIYTEDNSMSAQWEIQVLVTEDGYEIIAY